MTFSFTSWVRSEITLKDFFTMQKDACTLIVLQRIRIYHTEKNVFKVVFNVLYS